MATRTFFVLTWAMLFLGYGRPLCAQVNELRAGDDGPFQLQVAGQSTENQVASNASSATAEAWSPGLVSGETTGMSTRAMDFPGLLKQLATSTLLVLGLCVAALWLFKKFRLESILMRSSNLTESGQRTDLRLESSLRLGRCNSLHIVHAGNTRLAVGTDATGIKSIVPLGSVFSQNLAAMESVESSQASNAHAGPTPKPAGRSIDLAHGSIDLAHGSIDRFGSYQNGNPVL